MEKQYLDRLGRVRIPRNVTRALGYTPKTETDCQKLEVTLEFGKICLRKFVLEGVEKRANVGIVRPVDSTCRVVIPPEFRIILGLEEDSPIDGEVDYDSQTIRLWKASTYATVK